MEMALQELCDGTEAADHLLCTCPQQCRWALELGRDLFAFLLTWQSLCPFDHVDQLPLPKLIQAGQQVGEGVRLAVVMASTHHPRLDGLQDVEEDGLALVAINACHHQLGSLLLRWAGRAGSLYVVLCLQVTQFLQLAGYGKDTV